MTALHWKPAHDFPGIWVGREPEYWNDPSGWVEQVGDYYMAYIVRWDESTRRPRKVGLGMFNALRAAQEAVEGEFGDHS